MADDDDASDKPSAVTKRRKNRWRPWLRAVHRDVGYVAVGLTFVYALSGIAVNHLTDWKDGDASYKSYTRTHELGALEGDDAAVADRVKTALSIGESPKEVYAPAPDELEVLFARRTLHVNRKTGHVVEEGQEPRLVLRAANWLHLNRGKKAWTYVADGYAAGLLLLATSGMFMIAGKRGLIGRGAVLVAIGVAIPVLYVHFAGGN